MKYKSLIITMYIFIFFNFLFSNDNLDTLFSEYVEIEDMDEYQDLLEYGCSLGCAIGWSFDASSHLGSQGGNSYSSDNLGDYKLSTAWVEGKPDYGIGERIIIHFDMGEEFKDLNFDGMDFVNGYVKSPEIWKYNSRVKLIQLYQNNLPLFYIYLNDSDLPQNVDFGDIHRIYLNQGDEVSLEINQVYPGDKYKDTAISEINLYGAH